MGFGIRESYGLLFWVVLVAEAEPFSASDLSQWNTYNNI